MSNFYVGQEVVCVINHSKLVVKIGDTFLVTGVFSCPDCNRVVITVGIKPTAERWLCDCGGTFPSGHDRKLDGGLFKPIDYTQNKEVTFEKIKEDIPMFSN